MKTAHTLFPALVLMALGTGAAVAAPNPGPLNITGPAMSAAQCVAGGDNSRLWSKTFLADKLQVDGIAYKSIKRDDNCFKVAVVGPKGKVSSELFDPNTLNRVQPLTLNRVMQSA